MNRWVRMAEMNFQFGKDLGMKRTFEIIQCQINNQRSSNLRK